MQNPDRVSPRLVGPAVKLENLPTGAIDWSRADAVIQSGETGTAAVRTCNLGDISLRLVRYSDGYKADHWCAKGHIVYVVSGSLVIEYEDETRTLLGSGTSWYASDDFQSAASSAERLGGDGIHRRLTTQRCLSRNVAVEPIPNHAVVRLIAISPRQATMLTALRAVFGKMGNRRKIERTPSGLRGLTALRR